MSKFKYSSLFQFGYADTDYEFISSEGITQKKFNDKNILDGLSDYDLYVFYKKYSQFFCKDNDKRNMNVINGTIHNVKKRLGSKIVT